NADAVADTMTSEQIAALFEQRELREAKMRSAPPAHLESNPALAEETKEPRGRRRKVRGARRCKRERDIAIHAAAARALAAPVPVEATSFEATSVEATSVEAVHNAARDSEFDDALRSACDAGG